MINHNKPFISEIDLKRVTSVLRCGHIADGKETAKFEELFCDFLKFNGQAAAVSSGTAALYMALFALDVQNEDEVILPTYVCSALLNAIFFIGAKPVLVDINCLDFNISPEEVRKKINKKTKAIIVPHIYGFPAEVKTILEFGIPVIEDCAQSLGAKINNRNTGTFGDLAVFSFYATKLMTTGQGGIVISKNRGLTNKIRDFREFDCRKEYKKRFNFKMTDFQAALGNSQLKELPAFLKKRRDIAGQYLKYFNDFGIQVNFQQAATNYQPVYYRFVIKSADKIKDIQALFKKNRIETIIPIKKIELLHRYLSLKKENFPISEKIAETTLSIPLYPALKKTEVKKICETIAQIEKIR